MNIVVTGEIGIGKTTVCRKVLEIVRSLGYTCGGIITGKAPDQSIIIEDVQTGGKETLASTNNIYEGPHTGKYFFNPAGIEFGIRAIDRGASADVLLVDEIGYLELGGGGFVKALELIRTEKVKSSISVIRKELLAVFSSKLGSEPLIFEITSGNRNYLPRKIVSALSRNLPALAAKTKNK